jgi:hypothetical protein
MQLSQCDPCNDRRSRWQHIGFGRLALMVLPQALGLSAEIQIISAGKNRSSRWQGVDFERRVPMVLRQVLGVTAEISSADVEALVGSIPVFKVGC